MHRCSMNPGERSWLKVSIMYLMNNEVFNFLLRMTEEQRKDWNTCPGALRFLQIRVKFMKRSKLTLNQVRR